MTRTEHSKRIITAVVLAGATVAAILLLEPLLFASMVGLIVTAAAWEWCQLGRTMTLGWNIIFIVMIGLGVPVMLFFPLVLPWVLGLALLWWVTIGISITFVARRTQNLSRWHAKRWHALLVIFPAAIATTGLHAMGSEGRWYLLACLLIVWTTDTCAYMVGRICGKTLLAPGISPAKTVEGVGGGLVGAAIVALILYETLPTEMIFQRLDWIVLAIVTSGFSVVGDLTESAYKRAAGVKDSGWVLPGHGGVLDRIDSTFASSPVFVAGILFAVR